MKLTLHAHFICQLGSEIGRFVDIRVSKCRPSSKVCELKRSKNATIEIDFELGMN